MPGLMSNKVRKLFHYSRVLPLAVLIAMLMLLGFSPSAQARVPYIYQWEDDEAESSGVKKLSIEFDYVIALGTEAISINEADSSGSEVSGGISLELGTDFNRSIVANGVGQNKVLEIKFPTSTINLSSGDTVDMTLLSSKYPDILNWNLSIPVDSLNITGYTQLQDIEIPFSIDELEPGFRSSFMTASEADINSRIFNWNNARNINIYVPETYITGLETIHRYEGVVHDPDITPPQLSNIDVTAESDVDQVSLTVGTEDERKLSLDSEADCFTAAYAGLDAGLNEEGNTDGDDINIKAYNQFGKLLEEKDFKLKVGALNSNTASEFTVDDYIESTDSSIEEEYTLYELMEDPALMEAIISRIPVGQLDKLGVYFSNKANVARVDDLNGFAEALAETTNQKIISLNNGLTFSGDLTIDRDITIDGKGQTAAFSATAEKWILGTGTNRNIILRNLTIDGDLDVNAGATGSVRLEDVSVSGTTTIISGGVSSVELVDFSTGEFSIENTSAVRIIASGATEIEDTELDTNQNVTLVLDKEGDDEPSFGTISGTCGTLTWGAGDDSGYDMEDTAPEINIVGNLVIDVDADESVDMGSVSVNGTTSISHGGGQALNLSTTTISESSSNNGAISSTLMVTMSNDIFSSDIATHVTVDNLPTGLAITVVRNSATQITISFTGNASSHQEEDSVEDATVNVAAAGLLGSGYNMISEEFSINFNDNNAPANQSSVFAADQSVQGGETVTIVSSGNADNQVWFAPIGTTSFVAGATMTKALSGTATSILAPASEGYYKLYLIEPNGLRSMPSAATLTVDNTAPTSSEVDAVFTANQTVAGGSSISLTVPANHTAWFAATGKTLESQFTSGATMTTAAAEAASILAPATAGTYKFYLLDEAGNVGEGTKTLTVDATAPTAAISYSTPAPYKSGDVVTITATFNEAMADSPAPKIAISGANTLAATDMTKTDTTHYTYAYTAGAGNGTATITLSAGTDVAGNVITSAPTSGATFTVDNTAPTAGTVTMASNNADTSLAKEGDTVTLTIVSSEDVENVVATIDGNAATTVAGADAQHWTATYSMQSGDTEGALAFTLNFDDLAGNSATEVTTVTAGSAVSFDETAPVISGVAIADGDYKIGDAATVTITADASGHSAGVITINDEALGAFNDEDDNTYTGTYTVVAGNTDRAAVGDIPISVVLTDAAGNSCAAYTTAATGTVTIDANAPTVSSVVATDTTHITVTFDENLTDNTPTAAAFTLGGADVGSLTVDSVAATGGNTTVVIALAGGTMANGNNITLDYSADQATKILDAAGNETETFTGSVVDTTGL